jgi:hypothetical protein
MRCGWITAVMAGLCSYLKNFTLEPNGRMSRRRSPMLGTCLACVACRIRASLSFLCYGIFQHGQESL